MTSEVIDGASDGSTGHSVLIIHRYFWPENISETPFMLGELASLHLGQGDAVTVVTGASRDFSDACAARYGGELESRFFLSPVDRGRPLFLRAWAAMRLLILSIRVLCRRDYDIVYTLSYPPAFAGMLLLFKALLRRPGKVIYSVQDILTYRLPGKLLKWLYRTAQNFTLRRAAMVVTLSEGMKAELCATSGLSPAKIAVIPNSYPTVDPEGREECPEVTRDIIYAGAHGTSQNLAVFLEGVSLLPAKDVPTIAFFGDGSCKARLQALVRDMGLEEAVTFHQPVDRETIGREICKSRFGLVGAQHGLMRYALPSKLANYAAYGTLPLVMCETGAFADWIESRGLGIAINPLCPENIAAALANLPQHHDRGSVARAAEAEFGIAHWKRRYRDMLARL